METKEPKKFPLGLSDFEKIVRNKCIYVDKTHLIYRMIREGDYYFLSRPRRFGKSLLISTIQTLFAGKKELFKDLWICNLGNYDWQEYPVIRLDLSEIDTSSTQSLKKSMLSRLYEIAEEYTVTLDKDLDAKDAFRSLINKLATKNKVVLLIDEYDKPILDHIVNIDEAQSIRAFLQNFYATIKAKDAQLRFVLITGVSKFSKTSIFSGINNLRDISMSTDYATLLGYTRTELENYFSAHMQKLVPAIGPDVPSITNKFTEHYDGYQFVEHEEHVFNPYSVLTCLTERKMGDYWFASGTPTFLIKLLQSKNYDLESVMNPVLSASDLGSFEIDDIPLSALLFQTGYLTIIDYDDNTKNYTLGVPNQEVHDGLTRQLVKAFTQLSPTKSLQYAKLLTNAFLANDMAKLQEILQDFFNHTPYIVHVKSEQQLQFVLYAIFALIGVAVDPEVMTRLGRADLVVELPKRVYVIELKFDKTAHEALEQIKDKKYYEKYLNTDRQITLLGINFTSGTKTASLESLSI